MQLSEIISSLIPSLRSKTNESLASSTSDNSLTTFSEILMNSDVPLKSVSGVDSTHGLISANDSVTDAECAQESLSDQAQSSDDTAAQPYDGDAQSIARMQSGISLPTSPQLSPNILETAFGVECLAGQNETESLEQTADSELLQTDNRNSKYDSSPSEKTVIKVLSESTVALSDTNPMKHLAHGLQSGMFERLSETTVTRKSPTMSLQSSFMQSDNESTVVAAETDDLARLQGIVRSFSLDADIEIGYSKEVAENTQEVLLLVKASEPAFGETNLREQLKDFESLNNDSAISLRSISKLQDESDGSTLYAVEMTMKNGGTLMPNGSNISASDTTSLSDDSELNVSVSRTSQYSKEVDTKQESTRKKASNRISEYHSLNTVPSENQRELVSSDSARGLVDATTPNATSKAEIASQKIAGFNVKVEGPPSESAAEVPTVKRISSFNAIALHSLLSELKASNCEINSISISLHPLQEVPALSQVTTAFQSSVSSETKSKDDVATFTPIRETNTSIFAPTTDYIHGALEKALNRDTKNESLFTLEAQESSPVTSTSEKEPTTHSLFQLASMVDEKAVELDALRISRLSQESPEHSTVATSNFVRESKTLTDELQVESDGEATIHPSVEDAPRNNKVYQKQIPVQSGPIEQLTQLSESMTERTIGSQVVELNIQPSPSTEQTISSKSTNSSSANLVEFDSLAKLSDVVSDVAPDAIHSADEQLSLGRNHQPAATDTPVSWTDSTKSVNTAYNTEVNIERPRTRNRHSQVSHPLDDQTTKQTKTALQLNPSGTSILPQQSQAKVVAEISQFATKNSSQVQNGRNQNKAPDNNLISVTEGLGTPNSKHEISERLNTTPLTTRAKKQSRRPSISSDDGINAVTSSTQYSENAFDLSAVDSAKNDTAPKQNSAQEQSYSSLENLETLDNNNTLSYSNGQLESQVLAPLKDSRESVRNVETDKTKNTSSTVQQSKIVGLAHSDTRLGMPLMGDMKDSATSRVYRVPVENFAQSTSSIVSQFRASHGGSARMILTPEALGTVVVNLRMQESERSLHVEVANQSAKAAVESQMVQLRESLAVSGVHIDRIQVTVRESDSAQTQSNMNHQQSGQQKHDDRESRASFLKSFESQKSEREPNGRERGESSKNGRGKYQQQRRNGSGKFEQYA